MEHAHANPGDSKNTLRGAKQRKMIKAETYCGDDAL